MDDWQDAVFSSRHMHNRVGAHGKSKYSKPFDVRKVFGSYNVKCAAWQKVLESTQEGHLDQAASLELYRLTEDGEGVIGELFMPSALNAGVIFAASRKSLQRTVSRMEHGDLEDTQDTASTDDLDQESVENTHDVSDDDPPEDRFSTFEKNSFRSPKFWFQWSGIPIAKTTSGSKETGMPESGLGYVVFTGNDCRKFKGTINCTSLKWKDVSIAGHKVAPRNETDIPVAWPYTTGVI